MEKVVTGVMRDPASLPNPDTESKIDFTKNFFIDNFLADDEFKALQDAIMFNDQFPLTAVKNVSTSRIWNPEQTEKEKKQFWSYNFVHLIYVNDAPQSEIFVPLYNAFLPKFLDLGIIKSLTRIKVNVYPNTETVREHADHTDRPYFIKAGLFGLNTCDGYTTIGEKKLPSVANRMYFFDASKPHRSSTTTDTELRYNINFNFL